ncbi:MAG: Flagellar biosynthetic protein FliR [Syntrophorhabdaceae bacterium PtaU1.Bin034]|nr:MAG: Flagellar biosynthetic protein FliR [Syntrophorhabdaceae bacterium PtaU1.Bin034]
MIDIGFEAQRFILVFFRVLSMISLLPLFQSRSISGGYKAALSLSIAFLLFGSVSVPDLHGDPYLLLLMILKEVLIGFSIGFFVRVLLSMASAAGELVSMQSGLSFARSMDPTMMTQTTVLEQFQGLLAIMIFLGIDGHLTLLKSLSVSLKEVPPGSVSIKPALFKYMIDVVGKLFGASLKICAPVVVTLFLVDIVLGILARMIPQVNVFIEGASIKILVALAMLAFSLNLIVPIVAGLFKGMDTEVLRIMRYLG